MPQLFVGCLLAFFHFTGLKRILDFTSHGGIIFSFCVFFLFAHYIFFRKPKDLELFCFYLLNICFHNCHAKMRNSLLMEQQKQFLLIFLIDKIVLKGFFSLCFDPQQKKIYKFLYTWLLVSQNLQSLVIALLK